MSAGEDEEISTDISIREAKEDELDKILSIARENFMYVPPKRALRLFQEGTLKVVVAVLSTGDIVGTFWVVGYPGRTWSLISGITLKYPYPTTLRNELFERACSLLLPRRKTYINSPISFRSYFLTLSYLHRGDLHLYGCDTSKILLPPCEVLNYSVQKIAGRIDDETFFRVKEENAIVGKGSLVYFEGYWLIGRLIAKNRVIARLLFKNLMREIKASMLYGTVYAYCHSRTNNINFIREFGFTKRATEWIQYCSIEPVRQKLCMSRLYCLDSVVLEIF